VHLTWPLVGRDEELRIVEAAISDPELSGLILCGAAGVGKSRLAREALASRAARHCETRWVAGTSAARSLPLGAFASWVRAPITADLQLVGSVIAEITDVPPGTGVLVGVDDVHLLDDLSIFVVHQILQRGAAKVVLTLREGERVPESAQEIWKVGQFERLDVQPLSRDETTDLVAAALGGVLDPDSARRLWKLTRGNVLYLRNIVEQEAGSGRLALRNGCWTWSGAPVVPPNLVEMVESRIGALSPDVNDVIDALAVGEPLDVATLTRITQPSAVEEAERRGLITLDSVHGHVEARVAHPLYAKIRRKRAASTTLRRLRGLIVNELSSAEVSTDMRTAVRRATLALDSDLAPDSALLERAAEGAACLGDLRLADRLAAAAIVAGAGADAYFVRAHALSWLSRGAEADAVLAEAPSSGLGPSDYGRLAFLRATNHLWTLGKPERAKESMDAAASDDRASASGCLGAFETHYAAAMGRPRDAVARSESLVLQDLPEFVGSVTSWALTVAWGDVGRVADAEEAAEIGYAIASRSLAAGQMRFTIADGHLGALLHAGRITDAHEVVSRIRQDSADLPGVGQIMSVALAGRAALAAGRLDSACSRFKPVIAVLIEAGESNGFGYRYGIPYSIALAMLGHADDAAAALAACEDAYHPSWRCIEYERVLAKAWVAAARGTMSLAGQTALSAAEIAKDNGQFGCEVECRQAAAQFGDVSSAERLAELAEVVDGPRAGLAARLCVGLRDGDGGELASVSQEYERIGDLVVAADAAGHAAVAYRQRGLRGSAIGCGTRAQSLAHACGGALTPGVRQSIERLPLTRREREIALLVAAGMSNRSLAAHLNLSVRTVEGHIYRAMTKTGCSTRDELSTLLSPRSASV
jgi:DNA-binding CsgD family transcriptional regulator